MSRRRLLALTGLSGLSGGAALGQAGWPAERVAGRFRCHADFDLSSVEPLLGHLSSLERDVASVLRIPTGDEPIHLFLFHDFRAYRSYLRAHFPQAASRQAIFIKSRGPGMVFAYHSSALAVDVRHESTHAVLHSALPMVPLWLDEGLAEYFEPPPAERPAGPFHMRQVRWQSRWGRVRELRELERLARMEDMKAADYRDAWSWVHFMLHGPAEARDELQRFLGEIAQHSPPGELSRRLHHRISGLDRAYLTHFRQWSATARRP